MSKNLAPLLASAIGAIYFFFLFGVGPLVPQNLNWLYHGDTIGQLSGWLFYRNSPWTFPLGSISTWVPNLKLTIIQADTIPLFSLLFKIFSPILADQFQYFGFWLFTCFCLQGYWAAKLLRYFTRDLILILLGSAFFILSPPLLWRLDHKSLCAHWLLIAAIYLYVSFQKEKDLLAINWKFFFLLVLCMLIHPYLFAMVFPLQFAIFYAAHQNQISLKPLLWRGPAQLIILGALAFCLGYFQIHSSVAWGWPQFSTDLLAFINSYGNSALLPHIRHGGSQHEGFAYLGLGGILLGALALQKRKADFFGFDTRPLWALCLLLWIYALSSHITLGGNTILKLDFFYDQLPFLTGTFRSSGRFLWPLYYLILLTCIIGALIETNIRRAQMILAFLLLVQFFDIYAWAGNRSLHLPPSLLISSISQPLERLLTNQKKLNLFPPRLISEGTNCGEDAFNSELLNTLQIFAALHRLEFNSSLAARANNRDTNALCSKGMEAIEKGELDADAIYIVSTKQEFAERFKKGAGQAAKCQPMDGYSACVPTPMSERNTGVTKQINTSPK